MSSVTNLVFEEPRRLAFRFEPVVVRQFIPDSVRGAYLLTVGPHPVYVGRSDHCLKSRLAGHPLLSFASHFVWELAKSPIEAFHWECAWYHALKIRGRFLNVIHPAQPASSDERCPFCSVGDIDALKVAIPHFANVT